MWIIVIRSEGGLSCIMPIYVMTAWFSSIPPFILFSRGLTHMYLLSVSPDVYRPIDAIVVTPHVFVSLYMCSVIFFLNYANDQAIIICFKIVDS